jgi:hypothetical protein
MCVNVCPPFIPTFCGGGQVNEKYLDTHTHKHIRRDSSLCGALVFFSSSIKERWFLYNKATSSSVAADIWRWWEAFEIPQTRTEHFRS